mmetsp:Transcript_27173/g.68139  ORF Transcript_27173/g.68139 Transcript_27173/m.68139 type:complete len:112 (+) Transcript_27173:71-406(+)
MRAHFFVGIRDAAMAWNLASAMGRGAFCFHVCGSFHMEKGLGLMEHLRDYMGWDRGSQESGAFAESAGGVATVVFVPTHHLELGFDMERHRGLADVVVLTDAGDPAEGVPV